MRAASMASMTPGSVTAVTSMGPPFGSDAPTDLLDRWRTNVADPRCPVNGLVTG